jgi:hypothetical protein
MPFIQVYNTSASYGIFVVSADTSNGVWKYTLNNGSTFTEFQLSTNYGLLLGAPNTAVGVKFFPYPNFYGGADIVFGLYDLVALPVNDSPAGTVYNVGPRNTSNGKYSTNRSDYIVTQTIIPYVSPNFPMELYFSSFTQTDSTAIAALRRGDLSKSAGVHLTTLKNQYVLQYILSQKAVDPNNTYSFKDETELAMYRIALNDMYYLENRETS